MKKRWSALIRMPGEWLEIVAGVGAMLWAAGWIRLLAAIGPGHHPVSYRELAALPPIVQGMLVAVAVLGGLLQAATAIVNEARLRFCSSVGMATFFVLIVAYLWSTAGFGPSAASCSVLIILSVVAAVLLGISGYIRL